MLRNQTKQFSKKYNWGKDVAQGDITSAWVESQNAKGKETTEFRRNREASLETVKWGDNASTLPCWCCDPYLLWWCGAAFEQVPLDIEMKSISVQITVAQLVYYDQYQSTCFPNELWHIIWLSFNRNQQEAQLGNSTIWTDSGILLMKAMQVVCWVKPAAKGGLDTVVKNNVGTVSWQCDRQS